MTAALAVAREGYHSQQDVEKAICKTGERYPCISGGWPSFAAQVCSEIAPKPSPEERVTIVKVEKSAALAGNPYQSWGWDVRRDGLSVFTTHNKIDAERYATGLRAELAALVEGRVGK